MLIPLLAAPVLAFMRPATPAGRIVTAGYSCQVGSGPGWPTLPVLATVAAIAMAALVVTELTLAALARRARPADDPAAARLDDVLRQFSARAVGAGATALGLTLLGILGLALLPEAQRQVCPHRPGPLLPAHPWAAHLTPWIHLAPLIVLAAAVLILTESRRQDPRRWRTSGNPP